MLASELFRQELARNPELLSDPVTSKRNKIMSRHSTPSDPSGFSATPAPRESEREEESDSLSMFRDAWNDLSDAAQDKLASLARERALSQHREERAKALQTASGSGPGALDMTTGGGIGEEGEGEEERSNNSKKKKKIVYVEMQDMTGHRRPDSDDEEFLIKQEQKQKQKQDRLHSTASKTLIDVDLHSHEQVDKSRDINPSRFLDTHVNADVSRDHEKESHDSTPNQAITKSQVSLSTAKKRKQKYTMS